MSLFLLKGAIALVLLLLALADEGVARCDRRRDAPSKSAPSLGEIIADPWSPRFDAGFDEALGVRAEHVAGELVGEAGGHASDLTA